MADMEKVIEALEYCCADCSDKCPLLMDEHCVENLLAEALKLLKEPITVEQALDVLRANGWQEDDGGYLAGLLKKPEARVLTLDEVRKLEPGTLVWQENCPADGLPMEPVEFEGSGAFTFPDGGTDDVISFTAGMEYADEYGSRYRLWTAKPSKEQREAVTWDDDSDLDHSGV